MTERPLVTAIVPAYRHEPYVETALRSLIAQTYHPLALVVVDDWSDDATFDAVERLLPELRARFVRTDLRREPHVGGAANIERCLRYAPSDLVYMLDSDDAADPDAVASLVALLDSPDVALAVGDNRFIDDLGRQFAPLRHGRHHETFLGFHTADRHDLDVTGSFGSYASLIRGNYVPNGWLFRRSAVAAVGGYATGFVLDDWPVLLKLARRFRIARTGAILASYRLHGRNTSRLHGQRLVLDTIRILLAEREYVRQQGLEGPWGEHLRSAIAALPPHEFQNSDLIRSIVDSRGAEAVPDLQALVTATRELSDAEASHVAGSIRTSRPMVPPPEAQGQHIHLYALCWNDARLLPHFFRHYDRWVERYVIYDDGSDDGSLQLLQSHPRVEVRRLRRSDPGSFVLSELSVYEHCWKESRDSADWVFLVDIDEHLMHEDLGAYLAWCRTHRVTAVPAIGFEMVAERFPGPEEPLSSTVTRGMPSSAMSKLAIFAPSSIAELRPSPGGHSARPSGALLPPRDEVRLCHFKHLGFDYVASRHEALASRLGPTDRNRGWGHQWMLAAAALREEFERLRTGAVDVGDATVASVSAEPWWTGTLPRIQDPALEHLLESYRSQLSTADDRLAAAEGREADLNRRLASAAWRTAALEQSVTWRWTAPARRAIDWLDGRARPASHGRAGQPDLAWASPLALAGAVLRYGRLGRYIWHSRRIVGWTRGAEAPAVAAASYALPGAPVIVEVGCFLGCATVLLAGARKLRGTGTVHCIDPFDGSGDAFSVPFYQEIAASLDGSLRQHFDRHIRRAGLDRWVHVHQTTGGEAARTWSTPVDLLYLDGDLSRRATRETYLAWEPWLRPGGRLILSSTQTAEPEHDGPRELVREFIQRPAYTDVHEVDGLTFAIKA